MVGHGAEPAAGRVLRGHVRDAAAKRRAGASRGPARAAGMQEPSRQSSNLSIANTLQFLFDSDLDGYLMLQMFVLCVMMRNVPC